MPSLAAPVESAKGCPSIATGMLQPIEVARIPLGRYNPSGIRAKLRFVASAFSAKAPRLQLSSIWSRRFAYSIVRAVSFIKNSRWYADQKDYWESRDGARLYAARLDEIGEIRGLFVFLKIDLQSGRTFM
jgi:hypothetical protein